MAVVKIGDYDIWYHLRAGEYIIRTGMVSHLEPFSFTVSSVPWSLQSWLAGVVFYSAYSIAGVSGLVLFNAAVVAIAFVLIYLTMRLSMEEKGSTVLAAVILIIAISAARFRFPVRPHIFEFLFLAATFYISNLYRLKRKNLLFILPLIQALWANIHGSHILGLIIPFIYIIGGAGQRFISGGREGDNKGYKAFTLVLLANIAATFINPYTYKAFTLPFLITSQSLYMQNIGEWQPLQWSHLWGYSLRYTWGLSLLVILGAAGFIHRRKRLDLGDAMVFLLFLAMAIKGIRLTAEFAIASSPIIFRNLAGMTAGVPSTTLGTKAWKITEAVSSKVVLGVMEKWKTAFKAIIIIFLALVMTPATVFSPTYAFGLGVKKNIFPEEAVRFIEKNNIRGNVFNSFAFGDYLVWRRFPEAKVFIHGRNDVFP
ncbi:MAG: hypothetical protein HY887_07810, partial [Deltaproteobacteria bacterium]|nr:hypothetical protein [Deltaproteobacteria bacterium]